MIEPLSVAQGLEAAEWIAKEAKLWVRMDPENWTEEEATEVLREMSATMFRPETEREPS